VSFSAISRWKKLFLVFSECVVFVSPPIKVFFFKTHWRVAARPFSQAAKGPKSAWCDIGYAPVCRTFSAIVIKRHPAFDHCTRILASARLRFVEGGGDIGLLIISRTSTF